MPANDNSSIELEINASIKEETKPHQQVPLLAANSIHVSNVVFLNFTPALENFFEYLANRSHLSVSWQILQQIQLKFIIL